MTGCGRLYPCTVGEAESRTNVAWYSERRCHSFTPVSYAWILLA